MAVVASIIAGVAHGLGGGKGRGPQPSDFALTFSDSESQGSQEEIMEAEAAKCLAIHKAFGGK